MSFVVECSDPRGREPAVHSSGRGGAGNIRAGSRDDASRTAGPGPDDYSQSRGRELPAPQTETAKVVGSGRGGAGNIRSPSRGAGVENRNTLREEAKYVKEHPNTDVPVSVGRGGAGNISNSRSRSRAREGNPAASSDANSKAESTQQHHTSGLSKITSLFHRDHANARKSQDGLSTQSSSETPEHY